MVDSFQAHVLVSTLISLQEFNQQKPSVKAVPGLLLGHPNSSGSKLLFEVEFVIILANSQYEIKLNTL